MKEDKVCFKKNLMYLTLISVFLILFVVVVNYINSQTKIAGTRASGCQVGVSECGDGTLSGQCSKSLGKNNGYMCGCYGHAYSELRYLTNLCPLSSLSPTPIVAGAIEQILAACKAVKGQVAKEYPNYGGIGKTGYDHFNGLYYSATVKNPKVAATGELSDYCATEGIIMYIGTTLIPTHSITSSGTTKCGTTKCAGGESQGACARTVEGRRCSCPTGATYARYTADASCKLLGF